MFVVCVGEYIITSLNFDARPHMYEKRCFFALTRRNLRRGVTPTAVDIVISVRHPTSYQRHSVVDRGGVSTQDEVAQFGIQWRDSVVVGEAWAWSEATRSLLTIASQQTASLFSDASSVVNHRKVMGSKKRHCEYQKKYSSIHVLYSTSSPFWFPRHNADPSRSSYPRVGSPSRS